ncbi:hypothetical protein MKX01_001983 [Papaver californicum]|nr:hypothetical protein MKX01_001983 [Papaver californicum]
MKQAIMIEKVSKHSRVLPIQFLADLKDDQMDNLYPYVHLLPNGNLFIFTNNRAIQYDYMTNSVICDYPPLEGGPRNYPSAGSSVMLALQEDYTSSVIVVCGGAEYDAFIQKSTDPPAHGSCGQIVETDPNPAWEMEDMPFGRIMGDMVMLPIGDALIINGAQSVIQGFELATNPCLHPVLYRPSEPVGLQFMTLNPSTVPRMYHSTKNLLQDGRVLVAGSNPHYFYKYGAFKIFVSATLPIVGIVEVNFGNAPFATHSYSQGQRLVKWGNMRNMTLPELGGAVVGRHTIGCTAPPNSKVAPPGYYMVFAVNQGVPGVARWVQLIS